MTVYSDRLFTTTALPVRVGGRLRTQSAGATLPTLSANSLNGRFQKNKPGSMPWLSAQVFLLLTFRRKKVVFSYLFPSSQWFALVFQIALTFPPVTVLLLVLLLLCSIMFAPLDNHYADVYSQRIVVQIQFCKLF